MLTMYDAAISPLIKALNNLKRLVKKGEAYTQEKDIEASNLLHARLYIDMYPFINQIQIATDMSKGCAARLAGIAIPSYEDNENSFAELYARIDKTIAFLESIEPSAFEGSESKTIHIQIRKIDLEFPAIDYVFKWVLPNVHFHVTTAYNIMRHNGVELGKSDYLGPRK